MQPVTRIRVLGVRLAIVILAVYWVAMFVGTHLPKMPSAMQRVDDKVIHACAFFGLATLLACATQSPVLVRRFGLIVLVCLSYAFFDEATQALVRGRSADVLDFVADAAGTFAAVTIYLAIRHFSLRRAVGSRMLSS